MKKIIPVAVAIALICVVIALSFGKQIKEKYSYGTERADLNEYFEKYYEDRVPIILQDERIEKTAKLIDGNLYLDEETVKSLLTDRFYYDKHENLLLYSNAEGTIRSETGSNVYTENGADVTMSCPVSVVEKDVLYISTEYLKKFADFSIELFSDPDHIQMYTEWGEKTVSTIKEDTSVRWKGGVKSPILTDIKAGDVVEILEPMDEWTKVKTSDAYIGYVENKLLDDERIETETPVKNKVSEEYSSLTEDRRINMIWHYMEYPQDGQTLYTSCAYIKEVNVISPTWYWLTDNDGNFKSIGNESYVEAAGRMGMEVWPLIANFHSETNVDLEEVLSYTSKREKLINGLIEETLSYGGTGINIDFESVPSSCGEAYIQFIRELSLACHEAGLIVSVDNYVPTEYTAHYNRKEQGLFADYVVIMGYDEHYQGSEVGSVASASWMKQGIEDTKKLVPANKIINAVPFYTRVWKTSNGTVTSEALDMAVANDFLSKNNIQTTWDGECGQNYGEKAISGVLYQVWMEDADSIKNRLSIIKNSDIAGVAAWRLGNETPDIWDYFEVYMQN